MPSIKLPAKMYEKATFNPKIHMKSREAAKKAGYSTGYFIGTIAKAYGLTTYRFGTQYFFNREDAERIIELVKADRVNSRLGQGMLLRRAKQNRVPASPMTRNGMNQRMGDRRATKEISVTISAKTLMQMVNDGLPIKVVVSD